MVAGHCHRLWRAGASSAALWWRGLGALGLAARPLPRPARTGSSGRARSPLGGAIAFVLSILINVLAHFFGEVSTSIITFDASAYIAFGVVALLIVPEWRALPALPLRTRRSRLRSPSPG